MAENKATPEEKKPEAGHQFKHTTGEGDKAVTKTYKTLLPRMIIPGVNDNKVMTSAEIVKSKEAIAYLVNAGCLGTAIEEVV